MKKARLTFWLILIILPFSNTTFSSQYREDLSFLNKIIQEGDQNQKLSAISNLRYTKDPKAIPLLTELLKSDDEQIRAESARGLGFFKSDQSADALEKALNDSSSLVRLYAAESLTQIGTEKNTPKLVSFFIKELSKPNQDQIKNLYIYQTILEAVAKTSKKAPPEIINILEAIQNQTNTDPSWQSLYISIIICFGQIGDKQVFPYLERTDKILNENHQSYSTWYAVRKALFKIEPEKYKFDRPAADILNSVGDIKISDEDKIKEWIIPISKIGDDAIEDLQWALNFNQNFNQNFNDLERTKIAIRSLGYIGGQKTTDVLSQYIENITLQNNERRIIQYEYIMREAYVSLIKISSPDNVMNIILKSEKFSKKFPSENPVTIAINQLAEKGGQNSGDLICKILLESNIEKYKVSALKGLGKIKDYDPLSTLAKAAEDPNTSLSDIAQCLGTINSEKTLPILDKMSKRNDLLTINKLWIAAAKARLGSDYEQNAAFIREYLPSSLEQAKWLNDKETVKIVENLVINENNFLAFDTLKEIGTKDAFDAFIKAIPIYETKIESYKLAELFKSASQMAKKLNLDYEEKENAEKAITVEYVRRCFEISQQVSPPIFRDPNNRKIVSRYPQLAIRVWITEYSRRLELSQDTRRVSYENNIPGSAVRVTELFSSNELISCLEQIVKDNKSSVSFHTKDLKVVPHYDVRSLAAKILTEKTGEKHTFIDADGKERQGGWHPGMEEK